MIDIRAVREEIWRRTKRHTYTCQVNQRMMYRGSVLDFENAMVWNRWNAKDWLTACRCDNERFEKWVSDLRFQVHSVRL